MHEVRRRHRNAVRPLRFAKVEGICQAITGDLPFLRRAGNNIAAIGPDQRVQKPILNFAVIVGQQSTRVEIVEAFPRFEGHRQDLRLLRRDNERGRREGQSKRQPSDQDASCWYQFHGFLLPFMAFFLLSHRFEQARSEPAGTGLFSSLSPYTLAVQRPHHSRVALNDMKSSLTAAERLAASPCENDRFLHPGPEGLAAPFANRAFCRKLHNERAIVFEADIPSRSRIHLFPG